MSTRPRYNIPLEFLKCFEIWNKWNDDGTDGTSLSFVHITKWE